MENIIISLILAILFIAGLKETVSHFKGQSGCCGTKVSKPKNKKLKGKIVQQYKFHVEDMHCANCVNRIVNSVNDLEGVSCSARLSDKSVTIKSVKTITSKQIEEVIKKCGYTASLLSEL